MWSRAEKKKENWAELRAGPALKGPSSKNIDYFKESFQKIK